MDNSDVKSQITSLSNMENITIGVTCIKKQTAVHVCSNADCDKYAFVCASPDCECNQEHAFCSLIVIKNLTQVLRRKTVSLKPIEQTINKEFDDFIDKVSEIRDTLITECHQEFAKYFGLENYEEEFLTALQKQEVKDVRGKDVFKIQVNIKSLTKKATNFKESHERIKNSISKMSQELNRVNKEIALQIDILKGKVTTLSESSIIKSFEDENIIQGFFPKRIRQATLLYRASDHGFLTNKFHQLCDGKNNLLFVCETEFGKILGAYTPMTYSSSNTWVVDNTYQSFLYSVSKNVKFPQVNAVNTIYMGADRGPYFGSSPDFSISNQANTANSTAVFGSAFTNASYPANNQKTHSEILGSTTYNFKVKEWEVFRLEFN